MNMEIPVVNMIVRSGWVARLMLLILGALSVLTWAIIFNRFWYFSRSSRSNRNLRNRFGSCRTITELEKENELARGLSFSLYKTTVAEYRRIVEDAKGSAIKDWSFFLENQFQMANERLESALLAVAQKLNSGLILLAISSSVSPLVGLLGTVWGIMNSFYQIGTQGSASLPVVAPGIAEALITTIIGLGVAIPALFFYNYFVSRADAIEDEIDEFRTALMSRLRREILALFYGEDQRSR